MITEKQITAYYLSCDNCNAKYETEMYSNFVDEESAVLFSKGDGWAVIDGKHICDSCWSYNDDCDMYIIPHVKP